VRPRQAIKVFLKASRRQRLPGNAPDLIPDQGIRNYLKRVELKTRYWRDPAGLKVELRRA
jgi:hypothetical protein